MISFITVGDKLDDGAFKERLNRFLALVKIKKENTFDFFPNPGRIRVRARSFSKSSSPLKSHT